MIQTAQHTPGAFPDLTRQEIEELCLRQNQRVAELLGALKHIDEYASRQCAEQTEEGALWAQCASFARAAIAKCEGR